MVLLFTNHFCKKIGKRCSKDFKGFYCRNDYCEENNCEETFEIFGLVIKQEEEATDE